MARNANTVRKSVVADVSASIGEDVLQHVDNVVVVDDTKGEETKVVFPSSEQMIKDGLTTKSSRIRHLHAMGMSVGAIAKQETNGLYQHAYNVIKKELKTGKARDEKSKAEQTEAEAPKVEQPETETAE